MKTVSFVVGALWIVALTGSPQLLGQAPVGLDAHPSAVAGGTQFGPDQPITLASAIAHSLTVSLDGRTYGCGAATAFAAPAGADVFPCYTVENTGTVALTRHDLVDSRFGTILAGLSYNLAPGASAFLVNIAHAPQDPGWSSTWTAFNPGPIDVAVSADALAVTVLPPFLTCNGPTSTFSNGFPSGFSSLDAWAWSGDGEEGATDFWDRASCGEAQNWTGARGDVACASSDLAFAGKYDTQLRTHAFSLSGQSSARLEFTMNYQRVNDTLTLEGSTDNGANWQLIENFTASVGTSRGVAGVRLVRSLDAYLGAPAVRLRWRYSNTVDGASDMYIQLDNIALTCGGGIFFDGFESADTHAWSSASA